MLIRTLVAPLLGACCHLVVDLEGRCVVVDPGGGVVDEVMAVTRDEGWRVVGMLATHGHVDHWWSAARLGELLDVPLHIHAADAYRLDAPFRTLGPLGDQLAELGTTLGAPARPARVSTFTHTGAARVRVTLGAAEGEPLVLDAWHAPGHTEGSTVYLVPGGDERPDAAPTALTGDVLFAGSIGRTDLPGGDWEAMTRTLGLLAALPPETAVLPGHGPSSSVAVELATNPYLSAHR